MKEDEQTKVSFSRSWLFFSSPQLCPGRPGSQMVFLWPLGWKLLFTGLTAPVQLLDGNFLKIRCDINCCTSSGKLHVVLVSDKLSPTTTTTTTSASLIFLLLLFLPEPFYLCPLFHPLKFAPPNGIGQQPLYLTEHHGWHLSPHKRIFFRKAQVSSTYRHAGLGARMTTAVTTNQLTIQIGSSIRAALAPQLDKAFWNVATNFRASL